MLNIGTVIALIKTLAPAADQATIEAAVQDWLDDHPEATTTVEDGSITEAKLASALAAKIGQIATLSDEIDDVIVTNEYTEETKTNIRSQLTWTNDRYMQPNGATNGGSGLRYSNQIQVSPGDVISYFNTNYTFRFVTAFSSASVAVEASGTQNVNSYTVPAGIQYVVISEYTSRGDAEIDHLHYSTENASYVKPIPLGYMTQKGTLASGEQLKLPYMQVKNFDRYIFNANITSFSSVRFSYGIVKVEVNGTNLIITNGNGSTLSPVAHGITIGKNITLIVETETEENINRVVVSSDGAVFTYSTKFYAPSSGSTSFIESVGSSLTECNFSWVSQNINSPVWMFGDSYFSFYDTRWTYYLAQDVYTKNVMLNGYAGQTSADAYGSLRNLLAVTTPKIIVWCLGMNNPDTDSAVNAEWKSCYDKIIELQKKYGFELVLYTTPTTPTMNNRFKNAIVRESDYRYIEADLAVRIDNDGNWVGNGTAQAALAPDNVHPTEYGAKILYYRILADLPELMCDR